MRKRNVFLLGIVGTFSLLLFLPIPSIAQEASPSSQPSQNRSDESVQTVELFDTETQVELGYVKPDSQHRLILHLTNPSAEKPLILRKLKSECKCMTFEASPCEIPTGESVDLPIAIHFGDKDTHYAKRVILVTDDAQKPLISCLVKADVGLPLITLPKVLDLGTLSPGEHQAEILLYNRGETSIKPLYSTADRMDCLGLVPRAEVAENEKVAIPVKVTTAGSGTQTTTVTIHTNCPAQRQIDFTVRYTVASEPQAAEPTPPEENSR